MIDTALLRLLAAALEKPTDGGLFRILGDRLEECGLFRQRWILFGLCPLCGGEMKLPPAYNHTDWDPSRYAVCQKCEEDDVDFGHDRDTKLRRIIREIGLRPCPTAKHYKDFHRITFHADPACGLCSGVGIISR